MHPIRTNESNFTYLGPTTEVADLPCRLEGRDTYSVWALTPEERKQIAEGANIRLGIIGMRPIPPVSLQVVVNNGPWERQPAPCDVCGEEFEHPTHLSGPGTHAYRQRTMQPRKFG